MHGAGEMASSLAGRTRDRRKQDVRSEGISSSNKHARTRPSREARRIDTYTVVERLQALGKGDELSADRILQEVLPNQRSVLLALPLVHFGMHSPAGSGHRQTHPPFSSTRLVQHGSARKRREQHVPLAPLSIELGDETCADVRKRSKPNENGSREAVGSPAARHLEHTMKMWEDKMARQALTAQDAVYLLVHEDIAAVIQNALFLKASQMSPGQLMEVEMTLEQLGRQWVCSRSCRGVDGTGGSQPRPSMDVNAVSYRLFENVWQHGTAFRDSIPVAGRIWSPHSPPVANPIESPSSPSTPCKPAKIQTLRQLATQSRNQGSDLRAVSPSRSARGELGRLQFELQASHRVLHAHVENVNKSSHWIQEHCVDGMLSRNSPLFDKMRALMAARILATILVTKATEMQASRFRRWQYAMLAERCRDAVIRYCHLRGAAGMLSLARRALRRSLLWRWHQWLVHQKMAQKMERLAALVTIQSWMRCLLAKKRAKTHYIERAATAIQSTWRGYYCRKLLTRRRRYGAYTLSACVVQCAFRAYHNRCQFAICWGRHKAACRIARSLRRYCARRCLLKSWFHRVARFHSAAVIQVWVRKTLRRIRYERDLLARYTGAAFTMQRFFRYARFLMCFSSRVQRLLQRKHNAAVTLQNAYRAKQARARLYALKDQLEAQRRQQILEMMWRNAYATTLQRWWRAQQRRSRRHLRQATESVPTAYLPDEVDDGI